MIGPRFLVDARVQLSSCARGLLHSLQRQLESTDGVVTLDGWMPIVGRRESEGLRELVAHGFVEVSHQGIFGRCARIIGGGRWPLS